MKTKFPPREGDLPVPELLNRAKRQLEQDKLNGIETDVYFKFTCEECGERCTFQEANRFYDEGECCRCGHKTHLTAGGYIVVSKFIS